jgi:two-component system LytT family response regulator
MKQPSTQDTTVIPITEYAEIMAQIVQLKNQVNELQEQLAEERRHNPKLAVTSNTIIVNNKGKAQFIRLADIIMIESDINYSTIYLADGTHILTSKTLKCWYQMMRSNDNFLRTHRSFVVNKTHIVSYQASSKLLELTGGKVAKVSRTFKF